MDTNLGSVYLADILYDHLPLILAWRNDREIMQFLPSSPEKLGYPAQLEWFLRQRGQPRENITELVMLTPVYLPYIERPVGTVHYNLATGEVGLLIGEKALWGQGLGKVALSLVLRWLLESRKTVGLKVWAVVHPENTASLKLFKSLGFVDAGPGRNGQNRLDWSCNEHLAEHLRRI